MLLFKKHFDYFFFLDIFLGDSQYIMVIPHQMCTNIQMPICFSSLLCSAKGPPRCRGRESNPGPTEMQSGELTIELRFTPLSYASPLLSYASSQLSYASPRLITFCLTTGEDQELDPWTHDLDLYLHHWILNNHLCVVDAAPVGSEAAVGLRSWTRGLLILLQQG